MVYDDNILMLCMLRLTSYLHRNAALLIPSCDRPAGAQRYSTEWYFWGEN